MFVIWSWALAGVREREVLWWDIYVTRQARHRSVGGPMKGLPGEHEGQQQLPVLAPPVWEPLLDDFCFGAGL